MAETNTTADALFDGRIQFSQPEEGYRVAVDPVLLAAALQMPAKGRFLDAGCGTGAAMLCVLARLKDSQGVGLERQASLADIAASNMQANGFEDRTRIFVGDLTAPPNDAKESFDAVITNPPYYAAGTIPKVPAAGTAHTESDVPLADWITACFKRVKPEGIFVIIHRAERLSEIMVEVNARAGAVTVIPLWPKAGVAAKRVIVTAVKGRRSPTVMHPGLVLHTENGDFTPEAERILRHGEAFGAIA